MRRLSSIFSLPEKLGKDGAVLMVGCVGAAVAGWQYAGDTHRSIAGRSETTNMPFDLLIWCLEK